jgi:hypothetical protein
MPKNIQPTTTKKSLEDLNGTIAKTIHEAEEMVDYFEQRLAELKERKKKLYGEIIKKSEEAKIKEILSKIK